MSCEKSVIVNFTYHVKITLASSMEMLWNEASQSRKAVRIFSVEEKVSLHQIKGYFSNLTNYSNSPQDVFKGMFNVFYLLESPPRRY